MVPVAALVASDTTVRQDPDTLRLTDLLAKLDWNPAERGALLVVAPNTASPAAIELPLPPGAPADRRPARRPATPEDVPSPTGAGYHIFTLERFFDRKLVGAGGVSVLAPRSMEVLNWQRLPPPNPNAGLTPTACLLLLEASLSDDQWRLYGSERGLGAADLSRNQADLFYGSLPRTATILEVRTAPSGQRVQTRTALSDADRRSVRLSLRRELVAQLLLSDGDTQNVAKGTDTAILTSGERPRRYGEPSPTTAFGVTIKETVPAYSKPSQLNTSADALSPDVSLAGAGTVGEIVRRCADATHLRLLCDPRFAQTPVFVRGDSARAGDLLKALTIGLCGAFRQLEDAFLLTEDVVPLGFRIETIAEWIDANRRLASIRDAAARKARGDRRDTQSTWLTSDPHRPSAALERRIEGLRSVRRAPWTAEDIADPNRRRLLVPISELPPDLRQKATAQANRYGRSAQGVTLRKDVASVSIAVRRYALIPGRGAIAVQASFSEADDNQALASRVIPPKRPLPRNGDVAVLVSAETTDAAVAQVERARTAGFDAIWIADNRPEVLRAAVAAGRRVGIQVGARISLARQSADASVSDLTIRGEPPMHWAKRQRSSVESVPPEDAISQVIAIEAAVVERIGDRPRLDSPEAIADALAPLRAAAAVPGLSALVVGHFASARILSPSPIYTEYYPTTGYTLKARAAFARQSSVDPADLSWRQRSFDAEANRDDRDGPRLWEIRGFPGYGPFEEGEPLRRAWAEFRRRQAASLVAAARVERGATTILFQIGAFAGSLERGLPVLRYWDLTADFATVERRLLQDAKASSDTLFQIVPTTRAFRDGEPLEQVYARLTRGGRWSDPRVLTVFDLTDSSASEQTALLKMATVTPRH